MGAAARTDGGSAFPRRASRFIGRDHDVAQLRAALASHQLVTLVGTGGCGKTRLALEVASELEPTFGDGGVFVDLAPAEPAMVPHVVAAAAGVTEEGAAPVDELVWRALTERHALVVVDNCEGVVDAGAAMVDGLLRRCPSVTVLATSREPLSVDGEMTWRVPSLSLPPADCADLAALAESEAGQLLLDRMALAGPDVEVSSPEDVAALATICRRLDGIPLALELAASRLRALGPVALAAGLDDRFRLLRAGPRTAPPRQRTLEASIAWSYELLDEPARRLFRRLGVFAASFALADAVAVVTGGDLAAGDVAPGLADLGDRSLVQRTGDRSRLLESLRAYALEQLRRDGEEEALRVRHLAHLVAVADAFDAVAETAAITDRVPIVTALLDDARAAMTWSRATGRIDEGLRVAAGLRMFWITTSRNQEGRQWLDAFLEHAGGAEVAPATRMLGLLAAAQLALFALDPWRQDALATEGLAIARQLGDRVAESRAQTLQGWSRIYFQPSAARQLLIEAVAIADDVGDVSRIEFASFGAGAAALLAGDLAGAAGHLERGIAVAVGRDTFGQMFGLATLGYVRLLRGEFDDAEALLRRAVAFAGADERGFNRDLARQWLALTLTHRGAYEAAGAELAATLANARDVGNPPMFPLLSAAWLAHAQGDADTTAERAGEALPLLEVLGMPLFNVQARVLLGWADAARGGDGDAHLQEAAAIAERSGNPLARTIALIGLSHASTVDAARRRVLLRDAVRTALAADYRLGVIDALEALVVASIDELSADRLATVLAAVDAERERIGYVRFPSARAAFDDAVGSLPAATATPLPGLADAAAMAFGDKRPPRPPTGWASLTPAELRVARLVAEGLTNPEIGARLFLSRRTVQSHLSHVFAKLRVSSRAELATLVARHGET